MESIDLRQYFDTLYLSDVEVHQRTKLRIERLLELRPHVFAYRKREFLSFASTSAVGFVCGELAADAQLSAARALALWWSTSHSL